MVTQAFGAADVVQTEACRAHTSRARPSPHDSPLTAIHSPLFTQTIRSIQPLTHSHPIAGLPDGLDFTTSSLESSGSGSTAPVESSRLELLRRRFLILWYSGSKPKRNQEHLQASGEQSQVCVRVCVCDCERLAAGGA